MMTMTQEKVIYTAKTHTTGGREGEARSTDGRLDVKLSVPGSTGNGSNPEQLFAAAWSACFEGAIAGAARHIKLGQRVRPAIDAEVDLLLDEGEYSLQARLYVSIPDVPRDIAKTLIDIAERTCPYSKAIKGNVPSTITLV
jgi:Ohr subfamily peroxiredoxin